MKKFLRPPFLAALALVVLTAQYAPAQPDPNLKPTFGATIIKAGAMPTTITKQLVAGGQLKTNLGGVPAHVAKAPDFSLHYTKGSFPLTFSMSSVGDTTLLINLPNGSWIADDDSGGGLNPKIHLADPPSGRYDIFVGTYKKDLLAATLTISEGEATKPPPPVAGNLPDCYIVSAGVDNYLNANKLKGCLNDARNTVTAFKAQVGYKFRGVHEKVLLDGTATRAAIQAGLQNFKKQGAPGDFMVLFVSGHGGRTNGNKTWYFLPFDFDPGAFANTILTDKQILDMSDELVTQKKNVVIIVDACFCGQLYATAQPYLARYKDANQGSLVLMLSSSADQTSTALGNYSAYAKAFADTMAGVGDLNKDGKITLGEIKIASQQQTAKLLADARVTNKQDSIVAWSPSISKEATFAVSGKAPVQVAQPPVGETPLKWTGTETLPGYGKLTFSMYKNGQAVMIDAKSTTTGVWQKQGNEYTLAFFNGAVVYKGMLQGATLSGTATAPASRREGTRKWTWTVTKV